MANRTNAKRDGKTDRLTWQDAHAAINYISETLSSAYPQQKRIDDVIASLANAHENRRARQVNEWERMRQPYVRPFG